MSKSTAQSGKKILADTENQMNNLIYKMILQEFHHTEGTETFYTCEQK